MNKLGQRSMTGRGGGLLSSEGCYTFCAFVCHTDPFRILHRRAQYRHCVMWCHWRRRGATETHGDLWYAREVTAML